MLLDSWFGSSCYYSSITKVMEDDKMDVFKELFQDIKNESGAREIQETITRSDLPYLWQERLR